MGFLKIYLGCMNHGAPAIVIASIIIAQLYLCMKHKFENQQKQILGIATLHVKSIACYSAIILANL